LHTREVVGPKGMVSRYRSWKHQTTEIDIGQRYPARRGSPTPMPLIACTSCRRGPRLLSRRAQRVATTTWSLLISSSRSPSTAPETSCRGIGTSPGSMNRCLETSVVSRGLFHITTGLIMPRTRRAVRSSTVALRACLAMGSTSPIATLLVFPGTASLAPATCTSSLEQAAVA